MSDYINIRKLFNDKKCALLSKEPLDFNKLNFVCFL